MDGVLFDSQRIHFEAEKRTVANFGGKITDSELKGYLGWNEEAFWEDVIRRCHLKTTVEELEQYERPRLEKMMESALKKDEALGDLLSYLRNRKIRLAVASSADRHLVGMILGKLGITRFFDAVVTGEDVKRSKPAPDIFLEAAKRIRVAPKDCIVVEDAPAGIEAAKRAGMHPIALRGSVNKGLDLTGAEREIADLNGLPGIIGFLGAKPSV